MTTKRGSIFTDEDMAQAAKSPTLGPVYFSARRFVEQSIAGDGSIDAKVLTKRFSDEVYSTLLNALENFLIQDAESNIQGYLYRAVDEAVNALLAGDRWGLERYALGDRYHAPEVRAAIAAHIPEEIKGMQIADLEKEVKELREEVARLRARHG